VITKIFANLLSHEEEIQLARRRIAGGATGRAARDLLVHHNHGLVATPARRYASTSHYDDVVQAGYQGLLEAASRYDPDSHGSVRFATYAQKWIRKEVVEYLRNDTIVRIPDYQWKLRSHTPPTMTRRQAAHVALANAAARRPVSFDELRSTQGWDMPAPAADQEHEDRLEAVREALEHIGPAYREILFMRFYGNDGDGMRIRELAQYYGFSREWIGRLVQKAVEQLAGRIGTAELLA